MKGQIILLLFVAIATIVIMTQLIIIDTDEPQVVLPSPIVNGTDLNPVGDTIVRAEINSDNIAAVISTLERSESYYRQITLSVLSGSEYINTSFEVWADGDRYRVKEYAPGTPVRNTLILGSDLWRWYDDSAGYVTVNIEGLPYSEIDPFIRMLTYEDVLNIPQEDIIDAGFSRSREPCVYVAYRAGRLGYVNHLYVSQSTGLLLVSETYDGDTMVSRITGELPITGRVSDDEFSRPSWFR